jgi:hypothetical protein
MSVDQRLRESLHTLDHRLPDPDLGPALRAVTREGRRTTARRRTAATVVVAAVVALAAVLAFRGTGEVSGGDPVPAGPASDAPVEQTLVGEAPVEGIYRSDPVSFADMAANLRDHGLERYVGRLRRELGDVRSAAILFRLHDGTAVVRVPGASLVLRSAYTLDTGEIRLIATGGTPRWRTRLGVRMIPSATAATGPTLTLTFLDTTTGSLRGIPSEVWLRALYATAAFHGVTR